MTDQNDTATARGASPGRPATQLQELVSVLRIDAGESGIRQPNASYRCHRCHTTEGPVTGRDTVIKFVETVSDVHRARCTAHRQEVQQ